jgi:hypothetical protein
MLSVFSGTLSMLQFLNFESLPFGPDFPLWTLQISKNTGQEGDSVSGSCSYDLVTLEENEKALFHYRGHATAESMS